MRPASFSFSTQEWSLDGLWFDGRGIRAGDEVVALASDIPLPGKHNLENVLAALSMARAGGFDWEKCLQALRAFPGVEHRLEKTATIDGVSYINDSKSTNIDSLRVALESFSEPLVLLAGGRGKGADYRVLIDHVRDKVKAMIVFGEDAEKFEAAFGAPGFCAPGSFDGGGGAASAPRSGSGGGRASLPGCASFDMYANFEERGRDFKRCVRALVASGDPLEEQA